MKYIINKLGKLKLGLVLNDFLYYLVGRPKEIRACRCCEKNIPPDVILCGLLQKKRPFFFNVHFYDVLFAILSVLMLLGFVFFTSVYL